MYTVVLAKRKVTILPLKSSVTVNIEVYLYQGLLFVTTVWKAILFPFVGLSHYRKNTD
jgi:hypothetical protein